MNYYFDQDGNITEATPNDLGQNYYRQKYSTYSGGSDDYDVNEYAYRDYEFGGMLLTGQLNLNGNSNQAINGNVNEAGMDFGVDWNSYRHAADFAMGVWNTPSNGGLSPTTLVSWGNLVSDFTKNILTKSGRDADVLVGAKILSKRAGQFGVAYTAYQAVTKPGGATWGDVARVGIGIALVASPVGWFTLGYAALDITLSFTTGAGLTDRIGSGVDNVIKNW